MTQTVSSLGFGLLAVLLVSFAGKSQPFKPKFHASISKAALKSVSVTGMLVKFDNRAINEIVKANKGVDSVAGLFRNWWHFDNEEFPKASKRIIDLKGNVIKQIIAANPDGAAAREALGKALHTLQDFYSHSNWVEIGNLFQTNDDLGKKVMRKPKLDTKFCPVKPEKLGGAGLKCLTSGYFIIRLSQVIFRGLDAIGCITPPEGKCWHGRGFFGCGGIHKDKETRPLFDQAKDLAVESTKNSWNRSLKTY